MDTEQTRYIVSRIHAFAIPIQLVLVLRRDSSQTNTCHVEIRCDAVLYVLINVAMHHCSQANSMSTTASLRT